MRLNEVEQGTAEEQRGQRLNDNAKSAKDRAKQMNAQAGVNANS